MARLLSQICSLHPPYFVPPICFFIVSHNPFQTQIPQNSKEKKKQKISNPENPKIQTQTNSQIQKNLQWDDHGCFNHTCTKKNPENPDQIQPLPSTFEPITDACASFNLFLLYVLILRFAIDFVSESEQLGGTGEVKRQEAKMKWRGRGFAIKKCRMFF